MTTNVTRPCFTTQHQTCKTKTNTTVFKTKTDFFGLRLVLGQDQSEIEFIRLTVSDHITGEERGGGISWRPPTYSLFSFIFVISISQTQLRIQPLWRYINSIVVIIIIIINYHYHHLMWHCYSTFLWSQSAIIHKSWIFIMWNCPQSKQSKIIWITRRRCIKLINSLFSPQIW